MSDRALIVQPVSTDRSLAEALQLNDNIEENPKNYGKYTSVEKALDEGEFSLFGKLKAGMDYELMNKFMNDTDYNKFMRHIRTEKKIRNIDEVSPEELKKKEKNDEDK